MKTLNPRFKISIVKHGKAYVGHVEIDGYSIIDGVDRLEIDVDRTGKPVVRITLHPDQLDIEGDIKPEAIFSIVSTSRFNQLLEDNDEEKV